MAYSKFDDINAVLIKANSTLNLIETKYNESLHKQNIPNDLLVEIKDYLGNLRSSLDYLANKIPLEYFPVCETEIDFNNRTKGINESLKTEIKKWQPFQNNAWLSHFSIINNKTKHVTLIPQKRKEDVRVKVSSPQGGSVCWGSGVRFGAGVRVMGVPIDPRTQMPIPNNITKTEKITWISFEFDHEKLPKGISALPFLKICFDRIKKAISEIEVFVQ